MLIIARLPDASWGREVKTDIAKSGTSPKTKIRLVKMDEQRNSANVPHINVGDVPICMHFACNSALFGVY